MSKKLTGFQMHKNLYDFQEFKINIFLTKYSINGII